VKGKWAAGIPPRRFTWIIKDSLAMSERPGGFGESHRKVRRQEEIIWLRQQGFNLIVSVLPGRNNLQHYEEEGVNAAHFPMPETGDITEHLRVCYAALDEARQGSGRVLIHADDLGDRLMGVVAGYVSTISDQLTANQAIHFVEQLVERPMSPEGREIVRAIDPPKA